MFGPSISEPAKIVNRDVPECDIQAYKAAGYKLGSVVEEVKQEVAPEPIAPEVVPEIPVKPLPKKSKK